MSLFSIVIANYNNGKYFKDCFESILVQTCQNFEVIIVDDASTDNSVELIQELIATDSRFSLYQNEFNKGCGYTKRRGAELVKGELFAFLDPDDAILPHALEVMIEAHDQNADCSIVYSKLFLCDDKLNITSVQEGNRKVASHNLNYFNIDGFITQFSSFKTAYYKQTEGIDASLPRAVDQDLYAKLYEKGAVHYIDEALYKYRIHQQGISTFDNRDKAFFWFWVVIINAAKRRGVNVEEFFNETFVRRSEYNKRTTKKTGLDFLKKFNPFR
jgi:glycosyltransferase involved in cell wall biosynthesis